MAKNDKKAASSMVKDELGRSNSQMGNFNTQIQLERNNAVNQEKIQNEGIWSGMGRLAGDAYGGLNPEVIANLRNGYAGAGVDSGGGGGAGFSGGVSGGFGDAYAGYKAMAANGGIDEGKMRAGEGTFRELMNNGGYSADRMAQINRSIEGLEGMGRTGGLDAEAINRFRGNGVYDEFGRTGGWADRDKANFRARNNAGMQANFNANKQNAMRQAAIGGGAGNMAAAMAKGARQNAYGMGQANIEGELGLQQAVNQGRQWGTEGMTNAENQLQTLKTGNMLKGMEGAGAMGINLQNSVNQGKNWGASGITGMEQGIQSLLQSGKLGGLGGMTNIAANEASLAEAAAGRSAAASAADRARQDANERWMGEMGMQGNQFGLSGMANQYQATPGLLNMYNKDVLSGMGLQSTSNNNLINNQTQIASLPGTFDKAVGAIGQIGGAVAGGMTGIGALGGLAGGIAKSAMGGTPAPAPAANYSNPYFNPNLRF